ncbi:hypothetical protein EVAR_41286_1 [Eumeta japonica]|uniref:Uncharacterized protein n=1 Tax=Eumeta variegata TaxID=151549 RepID=A0A4C1XC39_EUMVA|nr:hypothetical protein EVAR_41286_1 [Eumeta japonica]
MQDILSHPRPTHIASTALLFEKTNMFLEADSSNPSLVARTCHLFEIQIFIGIRSVNFGTIRVGAVKAERAHWAVPPQPA